MSFFKTNYVLIALLGAFLCANSFASEKEIGGHLQPHFVSTGENIYTGPGIAAVKPGGCPLQMALQKNERLFLDSKKRYISLNYKPPIKFAQPDGDSGYYDFRCYLDDAFNDELSSTRKLYTTTVGSLGISAENTKITKDAPEIQMRAIRFSGKNWDGIAIAKNHMKPGDVVFMSSRNVDFCMFGKNQGFCGSADVDDLDRPLSRKLERVINQLKRIEFIDDGDTKDQ
ncbi:MAG: hypothetical protein ABI171_00625 [Collimonas sp.]|uniref:hypothetical protein n=1 Tax=Collimonas sp. TaxID=1963772 RepID=UPI003266EEE6